MCSTFLLCRQHNSRTQQVIQEYHKLALILSVPTNYANFNFAWRWNTYKLYYVYGSDNNKWCQNTPIPSQLLL